MAHPFDKNKSQSLTFADMKEMIARGLQGRLDIENAERFGKHQFMEACSAMGIIKDGKISADGVGVNDGEWETKI